MPDKIENFNIDRAIFLFEDVSMQSAENVVKKILELSADGNKEDIFLFINSFGGEVGSMNAIIDAMNGVPNDIVTVVFGEADSAAAIIASSGKKGKRIIGCRSSVMIHEVSKGIWGTLTEIEAGLERGRQLSDKLFTQLSKNTGKTKEYIEDLVKGKDVWMNATEAIEFGMVDKSVSDEKEDLLEILFGCTTNSVGVKHMNIQNVNIDDFKNFAKDVDKFVSKVKTENKQNTKEITMDPKDNKEQATQETNILLPADKLTNLISRIDELTSETTEANKKRSDAEAALNKQKLEHEAEKAALTSRLTVLEEKAEAERNAAVGRSITTFREVALKVIPKEVLDEFVVVLETNKVALEVVTKLTEAVNKATPLTTTGRVTETNLGDKAITATKPNAELEVMSPTKK